MKFRTILAAGAILFTGTLYAQTPDGETPANEGVCDDLMTATPGLYGLCIAYCEAQDLADVDAEGMLVVSKDAPKTKILDNYNRKMKAGDPEMPCVQTPIPCWTQEEMDTIGDNAGTVRIFRHVINPCGEQWYLEERLANPAGGPNFMNTAWAYFLYDSDGEPSFRCRYLDTFDDSIHRTFYITDVEYEAARDSIIDRANTLGWNVWFTDKDTCPF